MAKSDDTDVYQDVNGKRIDLSTLDNLERELLATIRCRSEMEDWCEFNVYWMNALLEFYKARGVPHREVSKTVPFHIARDISIRHAMRDGYVRPSDYRDQIEELIRSRFKTRKEFCDATGLSEDMLSHVLAGRKNMAITTLCDALAKIGYTLRIVNLGDRRPARSRELCKKTA